MNERNHDRVRSAKQSLLATKAWLSRALQTIDEREVSNRTNLQRALWNVEHALDELSQLLSTATESVAEAVSSDDQPS